MMTHTYNITGMSCSGCSETVKNKIEQHPDVSSAEISLERNEAVIHMDKHVSTAILQEQLGEGSHYSISEK